jgi:hypothetical protein
MREMLTDVWNWVRSKRSRDEGFREEDRLLDEEEAQQMLSLPPRVFDEHVKAGDIPCVRLSQRTKRFRKKALRD